MRIFFDMDGVLAYWNDKASYETYSTPGYFRNLEPVSNVVKMAKKLFDTCDNEIFICSACLDKDREEEKNFWLDKYLPYIDSEHRVFTRCGKSKTDAVYEFTGSLKNDDVLIDDFTNNLKEWYGIPVKLMNGMNGTKGTWKGRKIRGYINSEEMLKELLEGIA